ncbi:glutamate synthase-related protein [Bacteroidales bacterium MB20-C3-3]|nr:glutamate synthase-related protein [Bacteroidales bacterium MB20-C3-3]
MSHSPKLSSLFNNTKLRTPNDISDLSGMCSVCSDKCPGLCEIGLSAVRGIEAAYPFGTANNQFASEKVYPFDFSHFNINGRVFGAMGAAEDSETTNVHSVDISYEFGYERKIKLRAPVILPAMAKLNWQDYYSGAAMAGIMVVIGENAIKLDKDLRHDSNGKISHAPFLGKMVEYFRRYDRGYGDIILQVNADDIVLGTAEYALQNFDLKSIEIKFGQAAKGIQHVAPVNSAEEAEFLKKNGYLVFENPNGSGLIQCGRLPMWNEASFGEIIARFRTYGAKNIFFKMAGFDVNDIRRVLQIASANNVDLITFDGAGGGSGNSPNKMMNEWSHPTIDLIKIVNRLVGELREENLWIPEIAIAGGIAMEDTMFKALALGAPNIKLVGIGRAAMAAAVTGKNIGELIENDATPASYKAFGDTADTIFKDANYIKSIYKETGKPISYGAIGLYSYLSRLSFGLKLLMALNRKFSLKYIHQSDVIPLTKEAREYTLP